VASELQGGPPAGFVVDVDTAIYKAKRRSIWDR